MVQASKFSGALPAFKGKIRFAMDRESLGALVKDLSTERGSLERLIRRVRSKREWEATEPTSSATTLSLAFSRVRESAILLYRAACRCWVCDRHERHSLMIRLEHRIPPKGKVRAPPSAPVAFRLCVPVEDTELQRIEVVSRCGDTSTTETATKAVVGFQHNSSLAVASMGGLKIPVITVTETSSEAHPNATSIHVKSICEDARKARERRSVLSLELTPCISLALADKLDDSPHSYQSSISLADFLRTTAANADARMNPVEQTLLALNVVSSILQLRPTMWCSVPWNSSTIKFPVQATQHTIPTLRTPYVEQTIDSAMVGPQNAAVCQDLTTEAARSTMLELAILLLEILHHRSLATWAAQNDEGDPKTNAERGIAAQHWLDMSTSKLLPPHFQAVQECLLMCARGGLSWDEQFQRLYCENIIKPLQELALP